MWILKPAVNWCSKFTRCGKTQTYRQKNKKLPMRIYMMENLSKKHTYVTDVSYEKIIEDISLLIENI